MSLTDHEVQQIVDAIDERIEYKFKKGHLCSFDEPERVAIKDLATWWHENNHIIKAMVDVYTGSKRWWLGSVWLGVTFLFAWLMYLIVRHGWNPMGK